MLIDAVSAARVAAIRRYFAEVDDRSPSLLDLLSDDVDFFFPKFGSARGKAAVADFGHRLGTAVASLTHDIDELIFHIDGDTIVVEGQERGVMTDGTHWPDGIVSNGRFCNVFVFDGPLISRLHIYVDPDFTGDDGSRVALLQGHELNTTTRAVVERYFSLVAQVQADPADGHAVEQLAAIFDADVDWNIAGDLDTVAWAGPRHGRAAATAFFTDFRKWVEPMRFDTGPITVDGDRAFVPGALVSKVVATGKVMESDFVIALTVRDERITRYRLFEDSYAVHAAARPD